MSAARRSKRGQRPTVAPQGRSVRAPSAVSTPSATSPTPSPSAKSFFLSPVVWISLALAVAIVAVYAPVWHYDFVNYDDPEYVSANPQVAPGLTWRGVWWAFATGFQSPIYWHPLTWLALMLNVQLYGLNPGPHHLTNVVFHLANTILLFWLLRGMTGKLGRSAFVAGLFGLHPLHVESVAWVAEFKDVLSTLFWVLSVWAYIGYVRRPRRARYLAVLLLFALGLLFKPMAVTLPFVLLLLDFWPLRRVALRADSAGQSESAPSREQWSVWLGLVREKLPLVPLVIASSIITFLAQYRSGAAPGLEQFPFSGRVANALVSYVAYIGQTLWPAGLAAHYPYPRSLPGWWVAGSFLVLTGVSGVVVRAARRRPYLAVGWLWYLGTLVPVIGLVQSGGASRADHFTYVPLIGLFLMVAWGIPDLLAHWSYRRMVLSVAGVLVITACALSARNQVGYWRNSITLWEHTLEVTHGNFIAQTSLGLALSKEGRANEARAHYLEALRIRPDYAIAHNNLGNVLLDQGKGSEAVAHYAQALRLKPDYAEAHNNLGTALSGQGKLGEAVAHYSEALRLKPDYAEAHNNLGTALADQGKLGEALAHYSEALRLKPDYAEAHSNLGTALAAQGRDVEAMREFLEALRIEPNRADFHFNAAALLERKGQSAEAVQQYTEALRLQPTSANGHYRLGLVLLQQGKTAEAARHWETALRINPSFGEAQRALDDLTSRNRRFGAGRP